MSSVGDRSSTNSEAAYCDCDGVLAGWLVVRTVAWTLVALTQANPPLDAVEWVAWGRHWQAGYHKHPPLAAWLAELASMLSGRDATDKLLPEMKMPVLIVWGELDHIMPLRHGETIHRLIPQSQMEVVSGCGHLAPVQCADKMGPMVAEFLK